MSWSCPVESRNTSRARANTATQEKHMYMYHKTITLYIYFLKWRCKHKYCTIKVKSISHRMFRLKPIAYLHNFFFWIGPDKIEWHFIPSEGVYHSYMYFYLCVLPVFLSSSKIKNKVNKIEKLGFFFYLVHLKFYFQNYP